MSEKLVVGPINKGIRTDRTQFVIDNDSFPTLINTYQWRGRVKRKRGTSTLGQYQRSITITGFASLDLLTGLETTASLTPGSIQITDSGGNLWTEPVIPDGTLLKNGTPNSGTVNYASGVLTGPTLNLSGTFTYYPGLPNLGLEELLLNPNLAPGYLGFDTTYSYNISPAYPFNINDVSFYKNPPTTSFIVPGGVTPYVPKAVWTPTTWNGQNYQQFWSTNYEGAFWVTNGVNVPFSVTNVGMQFKPITVVTVTSPTQANLAIAGHGLVVGDFVFINEVMTTTGINFQTGYVTTVINANNVTVTFPYATITTNGTGGIAQYLTNRSSTIVDCIRWYDGSPTNNVNPPSFILGNGWVNFMPPLSEGFYNIANLPQAIYYLVGAKMVTNFKDRLLFLGPVVQASTGSPIYLQDTVIYSQNGTPYYTASYTNTPSATKDTPTSIGNNFIPLLVPSNQSATSPAWFEDQIGFGGFQSAGLSEAITSLGINENVLIIGFNKRTQTRFVPTGSDIDAPFEFFLVNSELPSTSTFSTVIMDQGVLSKSSRGYIISNQVGAQRIDLEIPDVVFEVNLLPNGNERFCAQRDFINEWVYFTYNADGVPWNFPNQTLQFNYRDNSYALFNEAYTTYGTFSQSSNVTWATLPKSLTWASWNDPWNSGADQVLQPQVIAGNQQGFILFRAEVADGTNEGESLLIDGFNGNTVTCFNHCLNGGDYIVINGALGAIGTQVNGKIFSVLTSSTAPNTFTLNPNIVSTGTDYLGLGYITRMYVPFIQTKQFPMAWAMAKKTRIGPQQYLMTTTNNGQMTLQMYLSQNDDSPYNAGTLYPDRNVQNSTLIYSQTVYTCPESTNLGLTPQNINLQMVTAAQQQQIWHRMNTSLIGDTVQLGFTLNDAQMRDTTFGSQFAEFELHGFIMDLTPSMDLA